MSAWKAWCAGTGEGDGEDIGAYPAAGGQLKKSASGTVNNNSLSFFADLRMRAVFLHSLEGISES